MLKSSRRFLPISPIPDGHLRSPDGIPPAPRGVPQIEVVFDIDANGILNVSARDKGTGKEQKIRIEASTGLSDDEIEKMKQEAKANETADQERKERIEKVNGADTMIFSSEKQLSEYGDKIPEDKKATIQEALDLLKEAHKNEDLAKIDEATAALNAAWQAASQDMYAAAGGPEGAGPDMGGGFSGENGSEASSEPEVQDVEFEEVEEDK